MEKLQKDLNLPEVPDDLDGTVKSLGLLKHSKVTFLPQAKIYVF